MKNLKKASVYFAMVIMLASMFASPAVPLATTGPLASPGDSSTQEVVNDWMNYINEYRPETVLDSRLASFLDSGYIAKDVSVDTDGNPSTLIVVSSSADIDALRSTVSVDWLVNMGVATLVKAHVNRISLKALESFDGVVNVYADVLERARVDGVEARPVVDATTSEPVDITDMYITKGIIGATDVADTYGYEGDGVVVGICDTGIDFSNPNLKDALYFDAYTGMPGSYDPSGLGEVISLYRVNTTTVENITAWYEYSSWNLLSYEKDGKYYINTTYNEADPRGRGGTHWDPYANNQGGPSHLDWWVDAYLAAWWDDEYPNQVNLTEFYDNVMRQDLEIPAPNLASGGGTVKIMTNTTSKANLTIPYYTAGYLFQQRWNPYVKVFAPVLGLNATHLIVDWNTTNAHTQFWNLAVNYGVLDFNDTSDRNYIEGLGDWSFVDDYNEGLWYSPYIDYNGGNRDHMVLSFDYTGDDVADFGLGALAHVWDPIYGVGMIDGTALAGRLWGVTYDSDAHGTFVAGQIASRGVLEYPIGLNGTLERIYGVANQSELIAVPAIGTGSHFGAALWEAGFDFNYTSGYWEWNEMSNHSCVVSSNSWGWVGQDIAYVELLPLYSLMYATISTPGYFDASYPGIVFAFSSGNSGPSYGTAGPPNAPQILTVGGSTSYHTFQDSYGPDQGYDQIYESGSRGPTITGYPKPDVVAPGRNVYGLQPGEEFMLNALGGGSWPSAVYAGTSMACPHVAGTIALMYEADPSLRPDEAKTIIQNTAYDLGMDAFSQGFGRVDALAAVAYIEGDGTDVVFSNTAAIYGDVVAEAWAEWMDPYNGDALMDDVYPTDFADGSLYYGVVSPGDMVNITFGGLDASGTATVESDFTWTSEEFQAAGVYNYVWNTYTYNETVQNGHDTIRAGYYVLSDVMGGDYSAFTSATYATILIGGSSADIGSGDLWAFVFDWNDSTVNGVPDYYNTSTEAGDELTRYAYGGDAHDIKIDLSHPGGISNLENGDQGLIVMVHDENVWGWPTVEEGDGNDLNVTIIVWELSGDNGEITVGDKTGGDLWANLTVPAGADPGVHQGYLFADTHMIPYSYFVQYDVDTSNGEEHTVASGYGDVLTPYEHGAALSMEDSYYGDTSGDRKVFRIHVSNSSAAYLGAKITWTDDESYFDISIGSLVGNVLATSYDANKSSYMSASAIADMGDDTDFYVFVYSHDLWHELPCNFSLIVMAWEELPDPILGLNWYSYDQPSRTVITTGGTATGDHVVMNATWAETSLTNMPDFAITTLEMKILYGSLVERTGDLVIPSSSYDPFSGSLDISQFAWEIVGGISEGDNVRVSVDFTNGDCDIMVFWYVSENNASAYAYANDLMGGDMATGAVPETGSFVADQSGSLAIAIFDYDLNPGEYMVSVDNRAGLEPSRVFGNTFEIDTYALGANASYAVLISSQTGTNIAYSLEIPNIQINNFFKPYLHTVEVTGSGAVKTIDWTMTDLNHLDTHVYEVLLSADGGDTFQLIAAGVTALTYDWDSSGFTERDYIIKIRVTDSYGLTDNMNSDSFSAGTVPPPSTPTTPTTPGETPGGFFGIDLLWIGLIGGIGVGVVVILILFLIKKR